MLVSTTLTGNNQEIIGPALCSVIDQVDLCIVIDTGVTDLSLEVAKAICGDKLRIEKYTWINDFADARNFSLAVATKHGATWALTLDTDERINWNGVDIREVLDRNGTAQTLMVYAEDGSYEKQRIIRVPTSARWVGPTHEYFQHQGAETLKGVTFSELGKNGDQLIHKFERDAKILEKELEVNGPNSRWYFYLGDTYRNLGRPEEAARAYEQCAAQNGWDEEAAWSCYRAAEIRFNLGDKDRALALCLEGLKHHPGIGELAWLAGFICFYMGRLRHSVHWSRVAIPLGMYAGDFDETRRIGFRWLPALWEKPYEVLKFALRALGDEAGALEAEAHLERALRREKCR